MYQYKPPKDGLPLVPMNEEEIKHMETIYGTRMRYFVLPFIIILSYCLIGLFFTKGQKMKNLYHNVKGRYVKYNGYDYEIFGHELTDTENYILTRLYLVIPVTAAGGFMFFKRIYPYKKDLKLGQKEKVSYTIIRKSHFPMTNQYFFSFDNPDYMHYEVDAGLYNSMYEGDSVVIYRGRYSKHVFEKDARFTLM